MTREALSGFATGSVLVTTASSMSRHPFLPIDAEPVERVGTESFVTGFDESGSAPGTDVVAVGWALESSSCRISDSHGSLETFSADEEDDRKHGDDASGDDEREASVSVPGEAGPDAGDE